MASHPVPVFKKALSDALIAVLPNSALYGSPNELSDVTGLDGSHLAVFWSDEVPFAADQTVMTGATQWFDVIYDLTLIIQQVGVTTGQDAYAVDVLAYDTSMTALHVIANDPTIAMTLNTAGYRNSYGVHVGTGQVSTGIDSQNQRGARIELPIQFHTRLTP